MMLASFGTIHFEFAVVGSADEWDGSDGRGGTRR